MMTHAVGIPTREMNRWGPQLTSLSYLFVFSRQKQRTKLLGVKSGTVSNILKNILTINLTISCRTLQSILQEY